MVGKSRKPEVRMEFFCNLDLSIWHIFFGLPCMMSDINIIWMSPLVNDIMIGVFPPHKGKYKIIYEEFYWYYLLTDGI